MINGQSVQSAFAAFWDTEKEQAYQHLCEQENLKPEAMKAVLEHYEFTKRLPRKEEVKDLPNYKVKLFERENVFIIFLKIIWSDFRACKLFCVSSIFYK